MSALSFDEEYVTYGLHKELSHTHTTLIHTNVRRESSPSLRLNRGAYVHLVNSVDYLQIYESEERVGEGRADDGFRPLYHSASWHRRSIMLVRHPDWQPIDRDLM